MNAKQYKNKLLQDNFNKRAKLIQNSENQICDTCDDTMIFSLATEKGDNFSIGLSTILQCLQIAENEGNIPEINLDWWTTVTNRYKVDYPSITY